MNEAEKNMRKDFISELTKKFGNTRNALLPILQEFQNKFNYIDEDSQQVIADVLGIHPVEVNSVISFYAFLYDKPRGRHTVRICKNIVCEFQGSRDIMDRLRSKFKIKDNNNSEDGKLTLEFVNCFGLCDKSPSMIIDGKVYENINADKAESIIGGLT